MTESTFSADPGKQETPSSPARKPAHVIIVGNEKGGSGKTTTTMHLIVALLRLGFNVGSMDIDARQRSLSRYIENRRQTITKENQNLPLPHHIIIQKSPFHLLQEAEADERERFLKGLARIYYTNDFVIIDTPGSDTYLARLAHSFADTVITPINDSFVDLDVLANVDGQTMKIVKPSIYSEMVWEQKLNRAKRDSGSIEWIVMRNRLSNIDARNKRHMTTVLNELSRRIGFRVAPGFSERVIFREMFLQGLTVLDVIDNSGGASISLSHVAARQEVRDLLKILRNPAVDERIAALRTGSTEKTEETSEVEQSIAPQTAEAAKETPVVSEHTQEQQLTSPVPAVMQVRTETPAVAAEPAPVQPIQHQPAPHQPTQNQPAQKEETTAALSGPALTAPAPALSQGPVFGPARDAPPSPQLNVSGNSIGVQVETGPRLEAVS